MDLDRYRVQPGSLVSLAGWAPDDKFFATGSKAEGEADLAPLTARFDGLQDLLYASGHTGLLVVLQGMDTSGKDGTIRHVFRGTDPLGIHVADFKRPSETELTHDYLWRVHAITPRRGHVTIFNRSHYEDVLVVRVHNLVPEDRWKKRYHHIREFERMLVDEGILVVKFFLHISKDEQKRRLEARLSDPKKNWKFEAGDLAERKHWDAYQTAYEAALAETSTDEAPWYVVPANHKWYRNLVVSHVLIQTLEGLNLRYPDPEPGLDQITVD